MINIFIFLGKFNVFLCFIYKELIYKDANGLFLNTRNIPYQGCRPKPDTRNPAFFCTRYPLRKFSTRNPYPKIFYTAATLIHIYFRIICFINFICFLYTLHFALFLVYYFLEADRYSANLALQ